MPSKSEQTTSEDIAMEKETTKTAKTEDVRVVGNLERNGQPIKVGEKITVRVDQAERLVEQGIVERIK
jgi:hypothetical protein